MNTSNNPSFDEAQAYIFASFSSNDRAVVAPILAAMEQDGYRVWYDTGAPDENAWPQDTAQHLSNSAAVLSFVTQNALTDPLCIRDVNFALMCKKTMVSVFMEPVNMPIGMQMQLSAAKSIYRYMSRSEHEFFENLYRIQEIEMCKAPVPASAPPADSNPFGIGGERGGVNLQETRQFIPKAERQADAEGPDGPDAQPSDPPAPPPEETPPAPPEQSGPPTHCPQCGAEAPEGYRFCIKCGAPLSEPAAQPEPAEEIAPVYEEKNERQENNMAYNDQNGYANNQGQGNYGQQPYGNPPAYGDPYGQPYNDPYAPQGGRQNDPYGQPYNDPYAPQGGRQNDPYGQPYNDPYAPQGGQQNDPYGQPYNDPYAPQGGQQNDPYGQPYNDPYAPQGGQQNDPYGQPYNDPYAPQGGQQNAPYGQPYNDPYAPQGGQQNAPYGQPYNDPYAPQGGQQNNSYGQPPYGYDPYAPGVAARSPYDGNGYGGQAQPGYMLRRIKTGEEVPVPTGDFVLGRSETLADYVITGNKTIGRKHAMITIQDDGCSIVDLESLNKTRINDIELLPNVSYELNEGDVIGLSNEQFLFHRA
ncbi:MAG: TIR domain-containing protein [Clostridia bacterium]|nr:TIR domain-containing protein [Clostridia bacterium]